MKRCNRCLEVRPVEDFAKNRASNDGLQARCRTCSRIDNRKSYEKNRELNKQRYRANHEEVRARQKRYRAANTENYKKCSDRYRASNYGRSKALHNAAKARAKRIKVDFSLSFNRIFNAVEKGVCERTGLRFDMHPHNKMQNNPLGPSVDRRDSFGPYSDENVQVVCVAYNIGKNQMTDLEYIEFCRLVAERNP